MMQYHKRIQELYEQAHVTQEKRVRVGGWDNDREPFEYHNVTETVFDPEKFAELIIKECIRIDVENRDAAPGVEIAKYFGVE
jgi:hypothetical protein